MSDKPTEEKKSIFDAMPENPVLVESPWKPGSPCTVALFGKNQLIKSIGRWSGHGTLMIFPANPEVPVKDGWFKVDSDAEVAGRAKDGPSIGLAFKTAKDVLDTVDTLKRLARAMLLAEGTAPTDSEKESVDE